MAELRVLTFVSYYYPGGKGGGPLRSISNIVSAVGGRFDFSVVTRDRDLTDSAPYVSIQAGAWNMVRGARVLYLPASFGLFYRVLSIVLSFRWDVLYLNSFFDHKMTFWALVGARLLGRHKSVLLAPRGEFSEGALSFSKKKKLFYIRFLKLFGLLKGVTFHASTEMEAREIQKVLGVDLDRIRVAMNLAVPPIVSVANNCAADCSLKVVFLSRLARKKNLDFALRSLAHVRGSIVFDVYGVFEDESYFEECSAICSSLPGSVVVNFKGYVFPDQVGDVLAGYDLLYFPTLGENYGHVIAESLGVGTPVLISDRTPWADLEESELGWAFSLGDEESFVRVLNDFYSVPTGVGYRDRNLVRARALPRIVNSSDIQANIDLFSSFKNSARE